MKNRSIKKEVKIIDKEINKAIGKRKSRFARKLRNILLTLLHFGHYLLYVVFVITMCAVFTIALKDIPIEKEPICISFALAFYGFLISVFAVFLSHENEKNLDKKYLSLVLNHPYIFHNSYAIVSIPTVALICLVYFSVFTDVNVSGFSLFAAFVCILSILFIIFSIIKNKNKLLISYYLPLYKRKMVDITINLTKDFDKFYIENNGIKRFIDLKECIVIANKNKFLKNYKKALFSFSNYFALNDKIGNNEINSFKMFLSYFRIEQYDYDSMAFYYYLCANVADICYGLIDKTAYSEALSIIDSFVFMTARILNNNNIKTMFIDFSKYDFSDIKVSFSKRIEEQIRGCCIFVGALLGIDIFKKVIVEIPSTISHSLSNKIEFIKTMINSCDISINKYTEIVKKNSDFLGEKRKNILKIIDEEKSKGKNKKDVLTSLLRDLH